MRYLAILFIGVLLTACAPAIKVSSDYDSAANFKVLSTYNWLPKAGKAADTTRYDSFLDKRVKKAITQQLSNKGFAQTTSQPDVFIAYDIKIETQTKLDPTAQYSFAPGFGYGYGSYLGYGYNYGYRNMSPNFMTYNYREGTIIVDMVRASDNELIWRGYGVTEVNNKTVREEKINEIIADIFTRYPPGKK